MHDSLGRAAGSQLEAITSCMRNMAESEWSEERPMAGDASELIEALVRAEVRQQLSERQGRGIQAL